MWLSSSVFVWCPDKRLFSYGVKFPSQVEVLSPFVDELEGNPRRVPVGLLKVSLTNVRLMLPELLDGVDLCINASGVCHVSQTRSRERSPPYPSGRCHSLPNTVRRHLTFHGLLTTIKIMTKCIMDKFIVPLVPRKGHFVVHLPLIQTIDKTLEV